MEFTDLSQLLPLGGAGVLLIYLLKVVISERKYWVHERDKLVAQMEKMRIDHNRELQSKEEYWRKRCNEAERRAYGVGGHYGES